MSDRPRSWSSDAAWENLVKELARLIELQKKVALVASIRSVLVRTPEDEWQVYFSRLDVLRPQDVEALDSEEFAPSARLIYELLSLDDLVDRLGSGRQYGRCYIGKTDAFINLSDAGIHNAWLSSHAAQMSWQADWPLRYVRFAAAQNLHMPYGLLEGPQSGTFSGVPALASAISGSTGSAQPEPGVHVLLWDYRGRLGGASFEGNRVFVPFESAFDALDPAPTLRVRGIARLFVGEASLAFDDESPVIAELPDATKQIELELLSDDAVVDIAHLAPRTSEVSPILSEIVASINAGEARSATVRQMLRWFDAERRGSRVLARIERAMQHYQLRTIPDYKEIWIDARVQFVKATQGEGPPETEETPEALEERADPMPVEELGSRGDAIAETTTQSETATVVTARADPVVKLVRLKAANRPATTLPPDAPIQQVATQMLLNNYSQIPLISGKNTPRGVVKWTRVLDALLRQDDAPARSFADPSRTYEAEDSFLSALPEILREGFVLVKNGAELCIVTMADVIQEFQERTEAFLLLWQAEQALRNIIHSHFSSAEIVGASRNGQEVEGVDDLEFGDYVDLFQRPDNWSRLNTDLHQGTFAERLRKVNAVRNRVMHFDPDGIDSEDMTALRVLASSFAQMAQWRGKVR